MNEQLRQRLELERDLRGALEREELQLFFQSQLTQFNSKSQHFIGAEVLLRWQRPKRGFIAPGQFIPLAEASSPIVPIGEWILHEACTQNRAWQAAGLPELRIVTNLISTAIPAARSYRFHPPYIPGS